MKKTVLAVMALASVALTGCVAVPAYDPYYGPGPYAYGPGPGVVVAPSVSFGYSRYYGYHHPYGHRYWR